MSGGAAASSPDSLFTLGPALHPRRQPYRDCINRFCALPSGSGVGRLEGGKDSNHCIPSLAPPLGFFPPRFGSRYLPLPNIQIDLVLSYSYSSKFWSFSPPLDPWA